MPTKLSNQSNNQALQLHQTKAPTVFSTNKSVDAFTRLIHPTKHPNDPGIFRQHARVKLLVSSLPALGTAARQPRVPMIRLVTRWGVSLVQHTFWTGFRHKNQTQVGVSKGW
jgi:hypothetical protein